MGFFILITLVFGVFMEMKQHLMIAEKILEKPNWFISFLGLFLGYSIVQFRFQARLLQRPKYWIFSKLAFLSFPSYSKKLFPVWLTNHLFPLLYVILILYKGVLLGAWLHVSILVSFVSILSISYLFLSYFEVKKFKQKYEFSSKRINRNRSIVFWFYFHLKEQKPLLLILSKLLSIFILNGFFYTYQSGSYDQRWLLFGLLIIAFLHFPLWLEKAEFSAQKLSIFNNLPLTFGFKLKREYGTTLLLSFPEILLIFYQGRASFGLVNGFVLSILWLGLNLGIISLSSLRSHNPRFQLLPIWCFFGAFFAIIYGIPALALASVPLIFYLFQLKSPFLK